MAGVESTLAGLSIDDGVEKGVSYDISVQAQPLSLDHCFVESFLTSRMYIFRLYHVIDADRIARGGPWNFNSHLLVLHRLQEGDDPLNVPLFHVDFWLFVHNVPHAFMSGRVAQRRMKFILANGNFEYARFEYDKLNMLVFGWDASLRAPSRRAAPQGSRELPDESQRDNSFTASAKFKGYELENIFPRSSPLFSPCSTTKAIIMPGIAPNISNTSKDSLSSKEISNFNVKLPVGQSINIGLPGHISGQNHNEPVVAFGIKMTIEDKEQDVEQTEALKRPCTMFSPSKLGYLRSLVKVKFALCGTLLLALFYRDCVLCVTVWIHGFLR
ncbi:hypothetical protein GQ457_16G020350 [Hibiscus cannabinus]